MKNQTPQTEIVINDKVCKIPQSWNDINLRQYLRLISTKEFSDFSFLAIMLDVEEEDIKRSPVVDIDLIVYPQLEWYLNEKADKFAEKLLSDKRPKECEIAGKKVIIPKDLKLKEFQQKINAEKAMTRSERNPFLAIADLIAIYLYPEFSGELYEYDKAMQFKDEHVMTMPISVAYPIGRFFLMTLRNSLSKKLLTWAGNIPQKRRGLGFKNSKSFSI